MEVKIDTTKADQSAILLQQKSPVQQNQTGLLPIIIPDNSITLFQNYFRKSLGFS